MQSNKPSISSRVIKVHYAEPINGDLETILERIRYLITQKRIIEMILRPGKMEYTCFEEKELPYNPSSRDPYGE